MAIRGWSEIPKHGDIKLGLNSKRENYFEPEKNMAKGRAVTLWCQIVHMGRIKTSWVTFVKPQPE